MGDLQVLDIMYQTFQLAVRLTMPFLLTSLVVGVIIAIFQAASCNQCDHLPDKILQHGQYGTSQKSHDSQNRKKLRHKGQGLLIDLGSRLKNSDNNTHDHTDQQKRQRQANHKLKHLV